MRRVRVMVVMVMVVEPERDSRVFAGGERWRDVNSNSNGERTEGKGPRRKGTDTERTKETDDRARAEKTARASQPASGEYPRRCPLPVRRCGKT